MQTERLYALLMQAPLRMAITRGPNHVFEFANEHFVRYLRDPDIIGRSARDVFPTAVAQAPLDIADRVYATGEEHVGFEVPYWMDTGGDGALEERYFNVIMRPLLDRDGEVEGIMLISLDVTQQVRERRLRLEHLRSVVSSVAHDLKNPLTSIRASLQLLRRRVKRLEIIPLPGVIGALERMDSHVDRMNASIDDLLTFLRGQIDDPAPLDLQSVELVALVRRLMTDHQQGSKHHEFELESHIPEIIGFWDPRRLERAITNILSNAVKFSPDGGTITLRINRQHGSDHDVAILRIEDNGLGIPADDLPRVFERYHRGANVIANIRGTGIGLSSALELIQEHGGTISVASREGVGTTFTICLPVRDPTVTPRAAFQADGPGTAQPRGSARER